MNKNDGEPKIEVKSRKRIKIYFQSFLAMFSTKGSWSRQHKAFMYAVIGLLVVLLILFSTVLRSERIIQVPGPTITVPGPERIVEVPGPERIVEVPGPERIVEVPGPVPTLVPEIIWPTTGQYVSSQDARNLLTKTFTNRRVTGAHFDRAALYTLSQFLEIRQKMGEEENNVPWPSLVDRVLGKFEEPGIEDLPVGWAYKTTDEIYLITILSDNSVPKIFGFDPLDIINIWRVDTDPTVEAAFVR